MAKESVWAIKAKIDYSEDTPSKVTTWMTEAEALNWFKAKAADCLHTAKTIIGDRAMVTVYKDGSVILYEMFKKGGVKDGE